MGLVMAISEFPIGPSPRRQAIGFSTKNTPMFIPKQLNFLKNILDRSLCPSR